MKLTVLAEDGKAIFPQMGCYGVGVSRVVAAAIEQNHDESGIIWPQAMAPFQIALLPLQMHKAYRVREVAEKLYADLTAAGFDVLMDDRRERPGGPGEAVDPDIGPFVDHRTWFPPPGHREVHAGACRRPPACNLSDRSLQHGRT